MNPPVPPTRVPKPPTPGLLVAVPCVALAVGGVAMALHSGGATPAAAWPWTRWGVAAATVVGMVGSAIKAIAARPRDGDPRSAGTHLQAAMLGDFLLHLVVVAGALFALRQASVKFTGLFGFGVAFAAAAFIVQLVAGLLLARWLKATDAALAAERSAAGAPVGGSDPARTGGGVHPPHAAPDSSLTSPSPPSSSRPSRHP